MNGGSPEPCEGSPLVTIMIPTYGQAEILSRAIESALAQDYPRLEVIVADDASPDDTASTVRRYASDARLRYLRRPTNLGRTANYRATLAGEARGAYVLNLDGDDWLSDPHYVTDAMGLVANEPGLALVFGRCRIFHADRETYSEDERNRGLPASCDGTDLFLRYPDGDVSIPHMTALYRRDLALELGFYEHDVIGADSVALLLLLPGRRVGFIDRPVGVWRVHAGNATWLSDLASRRANFIVADEPARAAEAGGLDPVRARDWRRRMSVRLGHQAMADAIGNGRPFSALWLALEMLATRPVAGVAALARVASGGRRWLQRSLRA